MASALLSDHESQATEPFAPPEPGIDPAAEQHLVEQIYQDLRRLAAGYLRRERQDHTLQATALVHETWFRLTNGNPVDFNDAAHFFRLASIAMRRVLVEHARRKRAGKRWGAACRVPLEDCLLGAETPVDRILDVDAALDRLAVLDERQSKIVEMRFFGGYSEEDIATALRLSTRTVKREWAMAKAWLLGELAAG